MKWTDFKHNLQNDRFFTVFVEHILITILVLVLLLWFHENVTVYKGSYALKKNLTSLLNKNQNLFLA